MGDLDTSVKEALARGDRNHAVTLVLRTLDRELRAYLGAVLRDDDAAKELLATLGEQLLVSLPRFRGQSSVRTYVYGIAWNLVRTQQRRAARARRRAAHEGTLDALPARQTRTPTPLYMRTTAKDRLRAARDSLTPEELNLIVLRVDRVMSWKEIGEVVGTGGTPTDTAILRKRFERLVRRLRAQVAPE